MTINTIQLPTDIADTTEKTLMLALNHHEAKVYTVNGKVLSQLEDIKTEATEYQYTDNESFTRHAGRGASTNDKHNREHYDRVFLNYFTKQLGTMVRKGNFEKIAIFVPAEIKNLVLQKLPRHILDKTEIIAGNVTKLRPLQLVRKLADEVKTTSAELIPNYELKYS
jgi:hypothetical protein